MAIISIIFLVTMTGISVASSKSSISTSNLRMQTILNYISRNIQLLKLGTQPSQIINLKDSVNHYFQSKFTYPKIDNIVLSYEFSQNNMTYFRKYKVTIEIAPGKKQDYYVYQGF